MQTLTANQIESTVTIITKQRDGLMKFAEGDGRARDAVTILTTAMTVLQGEFYDTEEPVEGVVAAIGTDRIVFASDDFDASYGVVTHADAAAEDAAQVAAEDADRFAPDEGFA